MRYPFPLHPRYDLLAGICLLFMIVFLAGNFPILPEQIPTHFNGSGEPDGFGGKYTLWFIVTLAVGLYAFVGFTGSPRFVTGKPSPWSTFRPKAGAEEQVKKITLEMLGFVRAATCFVFAYTLWGSIQIAKGIFSDLGGYFLPVFLIGLLIPVGWYAWRMNRFSA
jgi:uncharacterized membrane protein